MKKIISLILALCMALSMVTVAAAAGTGSYTHQELTFQAEQVDDTGIFGIGGRVIRTTAPMTLKLEDSSDTIKGGQVTVEPDYYPGKQYASGEKSEISVGQSVRISKAGIYRVTYQYMAQGNAPGAGSMHMAGVYFLLLVGFEPETVSPAQTIKAFDDVPKNYWGYDYIMRCTQEGAINGARAADANGIASFEPNGKVTLGQFLAVLTRLLCPELIVPVEGHWALRNYNAAVNAGYIKTVDFGSAAADLDQPLSREDMAYILFCAACARGEILAIRENAEKAVTDIGNAAADRKFSVLRCYSNGLLTGHGDGRFDPKGTMTRAEMAVVVCRLMGYTARAQVNFDRVDREPATIPFQIQNDPSVFAGVPFKHAVDYTSPIIIYEWQIRNNRPAYAGDVFVRKDGTWIVLKLGPSGVLGEGQGVAADIGLLVDHDNRVGLQPMENGMKYGLRGFGNDPLGRSFSNLQYYVNRYTGEGHTDYEWSMMQKNYPKPTRKGCYNNERYLADEMCSWVWLDSQNDWRWRPYGT